MATARIILDKRRSLSDGTFPLKIYISHQRKVAHINLNISVRDDQWDGKNIIKHIKAKKMNLSINRELLDVQGKLLHLEIHQEINDMTLGDVIDYINGVKKEEKQYLVKDVFKELLHGARTKATKLQYRTSFRWVESFADMRKLKFEDINVGWLRQFEAFALKECSVNSVATFLKNIRVAYNYAIDNELVSLDKYPFRRFKIKTAPTRKRNLTAEQMRDFISAPCRSYEVRFKDYFMLMFYLIGINVKDLLYLDEMKDGRIEYKRAKTGRLYSIKVEPEALEIFEKYKGEGYLLNPMDTNVDYQSFASNMNAGLKKIGKKGDPLFPFLTTYYARHSWATIASKIGIQRDTIAAALGHGGNTVTDIYIEFDTIKVDEANRRVIDYVLQKGEFAPNKISDFEE